MKYAIKRMIEENLKGRGITDQRVLEVMARVPRNQFVDHALESQAYNDHPLNIGCGQTISQPYIVALMTEALRLTGVEKVLEIGTGSGYQTAILAELSKEVFSIERMRQLSNRARKILHQMAYKNVRLRIGDGTLGWSEEAPFDAIIVTAGAPDVPQPLMDQLKAGGRMVIPVGGDFVQDLVLVTTDGGGIKKRSYGGCRFVKLYGEHAWGTNDKVVS